MFRLFMVLAVFVLIAGCGDDSPSGPTGWNNGNWSGQTSTLIPITFTLDHPDLTNWTITVTHSYEDTTDTRTWPAPALTIGQDSTFSWSDSVYADSLQYSFSMSGNFVSGDSVTGYWDSTVYYQLTGTSGSDEIGGNWTASGP